MTEQEYFLNKNVKLWNVTAMIFFSVLCIFMYKIFLVFKPENFELTVYDILILIFANFRLIRLFIYDNMTLFVREWFMDLKILDDNDSKKYVFVESKNSFKLTMYKLMTCPWCFGVWSSFISAFVYFTFPSLKVIFIVLSISAVASFLMLLTNLIGWHAEAKKGEVSKK